MVDDENTGDYGQLFVLVTARNEGWRERRWRRVAVVCAEVMGVVHEREEEEEGIEEKHEEEREK